MPHNIQVFIKSNAVDEHNILILEHMNIKCISNGLLTKPAFAINFCLVGITHIHTEYILFASWLGKVQKSYILQISSAEL